MLIGLDARFYGSSGGIQRYVQQLLNHLLKIDTTNQYVVFLHDTNICEFSPQQILRNENSSGFSFLSDSKENQKDNKTAKFAGVKTNNANFRKVKASVKWYGWLEQIIMPWKIWRAKIDLMHFPHWNVPLLYRGKFIVTIHDLILLKYPSKKATTLSPLFFWLKYWAYKKVLRHAIYDSQKIIVPSEFVKKDILVNFKVPAEKIVVIYEGAGLPQKCHCDPRFNRGEAIPWLKVDEIASLPSVARNDAPKKPYLLYVGVAYPHKNLEGLIKAFQIFYEKYSQDYHLVLAGQENYFYRRLKKTISSIQYPISYLGYIPDSQLPALYQNASLYVFPSFYEGFGLPGLEAMSYGLPVLASNSSCLPEIYGQAALYFNPRDSAEMADLINKVLSDKNLQEGLRQKGYEQIKKYSWEKTAKKTMEVYPAPSSGI